MKKKKYSKINPIDVFVLLTLFLFAGLFYLSLTQGKKVEGKDVELTVSVKSSDQSKLIGVAVREQEEVYLNSINRPVKTVRVEERKGALDITVLGKGEVESDKYIFNGQRVLIGQKAEIRGKYFAKGYIKDIRYAD